MIGSPEQDVVPALGERASEIEQVKLAAST
jgi:hypothetical protein